MFSGSCACAQKSLLGLPMVWRTNVWVADEREPLWKYFVTLFSKVDLFAFLSIPFLQLSNSYVVTVWQPGCESLRNVQGWVHSGLFIIQTCLAAWVCSILPLESAFLCDKRSCFLLLHESSEPGNWIHVQWNCPAVWWHLVTEAAWMQCLYVFTHSHLVILCGLAPLIATDARGWLWLPVHGTEWTHHTLWTGGLLQC